MKRTIRFAALAGALVLAGTTAMAMRQDPGELGKKVAESLRGGMEDPAAMEKWQKTLQTGPAHEFLVKTFAGNWTTEVKMWMDPAGEPMTSKGSATCEPILNGRFIRERFKGNMMGQEFEGEGTTGFDNNRKLFISSWLDSMSTGMMTMKGSISPDGRTLTFIGDMDEPMTGEVGKPIKMVIHVDSPDKHTSTMYEILYGQDMKVMEITYTRAGGRSAS